MQRSFVRVFTFVAWLAGLMGTVPVLADGVYWVQGTGASSRVVRSNLDGTGPATIVSFSEVSGPTAIAVDAVVGSLYWSDGVSNQSRIRRAGADGSGPVTLLAWPLKSDTKGIDVDSAGAKLYWAEGAGNDSRILRAGLTGADFEPLIAWPQVSDPKAIAVDTTGGKFYWAQGVGNNSRILRANLDGTGVETLPSLAWPQVSDPTGIAVDPSGGKLYWCQNTGNNSRVLRSNLDGSSPGPVYSWPDVLDPRAISLDLTGLKMYWAQGASTATQIIRANLDGSGAATIVGWPQASDVVGLDVVHFVATIPVIVWNADQLSPDRTTRSLRFRVEAPAIASGSPGQDAIKITMVDLQHPDPRNLPQYPPPNYSTFDTGTHGTCAGAATSPNFNGHHCSIDAECLGPNDMVSTDDGTCSLPGPACSAVGEMNGCARWVGKPWTFYESQGPPQSGPYRAARLQCTPAYWGWTTETALAPITVVGAEILPSSEYSVQTYGASCKGMEDTCTNVSPAATMYTRRKGDLDTPYQGASPAPLTQADVLDISQTVAAVKHQLGAPVHARAQMQPNLPELNTDANVLDIVEAVDSVKRIPYAFSGPCVCPSTVTCGGSCTGCPGLCVKTCVGGDNDGDPCVNNTHCPGVCVGGSNPGAICPLGYPGGVNCAGVCVGGANPEAACTTPGSQCTGGGTCSSFGCSGTCGAAGTCYDKCGRCTP